MSKRQQLPTKIEQLAGNGHEPEKIPEHRRCPICWGAHRGVGIAYNTANPYQTGQDDWPQHVRKRYYKCARTLSDKAPCGHTWVCEITTVEVVKVTSRQVELKTRDAIRPNA